MRLEEELNCKGLMGFATGYVLGKANTPLTQKMAGKDSYCAWACEIKAECWRRHQLRVRLMMPKAAAKIDELCKQIGQEKAMQEWREWAKSVNKAYPFMHEKLPEQDPYLLQMNANLADGYNFAKTGKVCDRGEFTLKYPRNEDLHLS